jgi:predicted pyridoxine 5'-phosphate oxidase superfamily flavin-nucleotide-binding protein
MGCPGPDDYGTLELMKLPQSARDLIESGSLAHLVTLNADGSPQVTCIWVGLGRDESSRDT